MLRRRFLGTVTLIGVGSVAAIAKMHATRHASETVTYSVQGFTCITCAVGLETLLRREQGVLSANANYPAASAKIQFDPSITSKQQLESFIREAGFIAKQVSAPEAG